MKLIEAVALGTREEWSLLTSSTNSIWLPGLTLAKVYIVEVVLMAEAAVGVARSSQRCTCPWPDLDLGYLCQSSSWKESTLSLTLTWLPITVWLTRGVTMETAGEAAEALMAPRVKVAAADKMTQNLTALV